MKRYHEEKHIIARRAQEFKQIAGWLNETYNKYMPDTGRFRKSRRCAGCTRARCQLCHPDKFPRRKPSRQETQAKQDLHDQSF